MRLKWFAGGKERRDEALIILDKLIASFHNNYGVQPLTDLFLKYKSELKNGRTSTSFVLSRMNIELSRVFTQNEIRLTEEQSRLLKDLRSLSNIRWGYY